MPEEKEGKGWEGMGGKGREGLLFPSDLHCFDPDLQSVDQPQQERSRIVSQY